jgi:DNA-binding MarR family transcriptional regulator
MQSQWYDPGMTRKADEVLAEAWHDLMAQYQRTMCTLDRELGREHALSASEFEVLQSLYTAPDGCMRLTELGEHAHLTQSALSRLVSRLTDDGLVERKACADDRRNVTARLTSEGRTRYVQAKPTQRRVLREEVGECRSLATAD